LWKPLHEKKKKKLDTSFQCGVICKFTEGALNVLIQVINKAIEQDVFQYQPLGNTTCDLSPAGFSSIHHHSLGPAIQPVPYPAECICPRLMLTASSGEHCGDIVEGFAEV